MGVGPWPEVAASLHHASHMTRDGQREEIRFDTRPRSAQREFLPGDRSSHLGSKRSGRRSHKSRWNSSNPDCSDRASISPLTITRSPTTVPDRKPPSTAGRYHSIEQIASLSQARTRFGLQREIAIFTFNRYVVHCPRNTHNENFFKA